MTDTSNAHLGMMPTRTSQLFVELLVIGAGTLVWLGLFIAAVLRYPESELPSLNNSIFAVLAVFLIAFSYALGIVFDRFCFSICMRILHPCLSGEKLREHRDRLLEQENFVLKNDGGVAERVAYLQSRYRICRAWPNLVLTSLAFYWWNSRVKVVPAEESGWLVIIGFFLAGAMFLAAMVLEKDWERGVERAYNSLSGKCPYIDAV